MAQRKKKTTRATFTAKQRRQVVQRWHDEQLVGAAYAKQLGINPNTLSQWRKKYPPIVANRPALNGAEHVEAPAMPTLDDVLAQIEAAGRGLKQLKAAYRKTFG